MMGFMIIYIKLYYKIYHKGQRRNKGNILLSIFYIVFEVVNYCYIEFSDMYILLHLKQITNFCNNLIGTRTLKRIDTCRCIAESFCYTPETNNFQFSSVVQSCPTLWDPMNRSTPSKTPRVHPNSLPSSRRCHPAISSSVVPFFSCPQSLPASKSFPVSQLFA